MTKIKTFADLAPAFAAAGLATSEDVPTRIIEPRAGRGKLGITEDMEKQAMAELEATPPTPREKLVNELRKSAKAIFISIDYMEASEISALMNRAADGLEGKFET